jgi:predicted amidohydrolase YtcJ
MIAIAQGQADLILIHGKIWTENRQQPEAEAAAVKQNRILAVGNTAEIERLSGPNTKVIDLRGRRMLPGFNDAHVHFYFGGDGLASVQLGNAQNPAELRKRIGEFARSLPQGDWILNGSWDQEKWTPATLPTHELIDEVTPGNPVFVNRADGHMSLANALAMKLAGVSKSTADVPGGVIVRDAEGNPTGVFKDAAKALIERVVPLPSDEHIFAAIQAAQTYASANGVTSVQDMGVLGAKGADTTIRVLRVYQMLEKRSQLQVRVSAHLPLPEWKRWASAGVMADFGDEKLQVGALKGFADGSLGSSTAWFGEPYSDMPENRGIPSDELVHPEQMYQNVRDADAADLQIAIHAIGDRANNTILNFYEQLARDNGARDRRVRIEHAQHLLPSDIPRFANLHVIASVQPYHCIDDGRWAEKRVGAKRAATTYAFRSLLNAGAAVAFGSDWPVAPISPLMGIYAATTRRTLDGKHPEGWVSAEKISVAQAVHGYTAGSAYASLEESRKGSIEPGKLADMVVLSEDIFNIDPVEIQNTKVDLTIFDGQVVYERK